MLTSQRRGIWRGTKKIITQAERRLLQTTGMSFKLSAQSSPHSAQRSSHALYKAPHDLVRRVYLSNAKAYKREWGVAGKLSSWPFDSCKLHCDTEHTIVAALRKARKGHVNDDRGWIKRPPGPFTCIQARIAEKNDHSIWLTWTSRSHYLESETKHALHFDTF